MAGPSLLQRRHPIAPRRSRRLIYPLVGAFLALGAPGGLLLLRSAARSGSGSLGWAAREVLADPALYAYVTLSTLVVFTVLGWALGRREDDLGRVATTDPLTGLPNRGAFEQRLGEEVARATRYRKPLSLLLVDLDGLKLINDRLGHGAGDAALRAIAAALRTTCRKSDLMARVGGDEFAVLAPETAGAEAQELAERIRKELSGRRLPGLGERRLSVSIGIGDLATLGTAEPERLVSAADQALYRAKTEGRDRTCAWHPSIPPISGAALR